MNPSTDLQIRLATLPKFVSKFRFRKLAFSFIALQRVRFTGALEINVWSLFGQGERENQVAFDSPKWTTVHEKDDKNEEANV